MSVEVTIRLNDVSVTRRVDSDSVLNHQRNVKLTDYDGKILMYLILGITALCLLIDILN
jgi:hypothetical protein